MSVTVESLETPIRFNADGVALIGRTRVPLAAVITAFRQGDSAEQIVDSYDSLSLSDVYAVIAYYLRHREQVDAYLAQQRADTQAARLDLESRHPEMFTLQGRLRRLKQGI
ncbi:MAG: DUF433 domain-containing protein [Chloroflexi bacterium]|nr:DUF433 domain-containing protein [Chloroflexota bacterium]